jgi:hypothetical protein
MGLSSSKQTTNSGPSKWAQGYLTPAIGEINSAYDQNKGATADIAKTVQGLVPGLLDKYNAGNPSLTAAQNYNTDVLGGKYLTGNPQLQSIIDQTANDVQGRVGGAFGANGSFGGTKYMTALGKGLGEAENTLRYNDYNTQMGRMDQAAGQAPSLAAADYLGITPLLSAAQAGTELPFAASNNLAQQLAALLGNSTTTTQKSSGNVLGSLLGAVGTGLGAYGALK